MQQQARRCCLTFQSLTGLPVPSTPGKLTSLCDQDLRDVRPKQDAEADEGLLKHHAVSNKLVQVKLVPERRHCPHHGTAIFPRNVHQVRLYIRTEPETKKAVA